MKNYNFSFFYGCEACSPTLREEQRLCVLENKGAEERIWDGNNRRVEKIP